MSRFDLTDLDRHRIASAREALAEAERVDLADDRAMARTIGRLETVLSHLLEMFDEGDQPTP